MDALDDTLIERFGAAVRQLREARDWSQEALAEQAGLNRSYVGEIERGEVVVSLLTVAKLAQAFGLMPSALVHCGENNNSAVNYLRKRNLMAIDG